MDDFSPTRLWRYSRLHLRIALARLARDLAVWSDIRAFPPLAVLAGLNCVAGLILLRQQAPLPLRMTNWRLCVAALATAGLTIASRWCLARIERDSPAFRIRAFLAAASVFPMIVLLTVATPRNSLGAVGFVSLLAVASGNANLLWNRRHSASPAWPTRVGKLREMKPAVMRSAENASPQILPAPVFGHAPVAGHEWTERTCDDRGQVLMRGRVSASFAAGQSLATVHIPFIPVFTSIPEFSCEIIDQPAVRARTPVVYCYGVRIEFKRSGSVTLPAAVAVEFRVTQAGCISRAA